MRLAPIWIVGAHAFTEYAARMPNGNARVEGDPALGHPDALGVAGENAFGQDYAKYRGVWQGAYCQADSDGDGFTNGQELGDPCCEWVEGTPAPYSIGISHPSRANSIPTYPQVTMTCRGDSNRPPTGGITTILDDDEDDSSESAPLMPSSAANGWLTISIITIHFVVGLNVLGHCIVL